LRKLIPVFLAILFVFTFLNGCGAKTPNSPSSTALPTESAPLPTQPLPTSSPTEATEPPETDKYVRGNSNANLNNAGIIVKQGDWIYYSGMYDGLYKSRIDGSDKTKLTDSKAFYINIVDDWLYFCTMDKIGNPGPTKKIRTDGTEESDLGDISASYMNIVGDWIYYKVVSGEPASNWDDPLFRMKFDGTEKTLVFEDNSEEIFIFDDWIYYRNIDEKPVLTMIRTDGSERSEIGDSGFHWNFVDEGFIYYRAEIEGSPILFRMKPDSSEKSRIAEFDSFNYSISDSWIYYENEADEGKLYKIRTDGSEKENLFDLIPYNIYVTDSVVYCIFMADQHTVDNFNLFYVDTEGKGAIEIK